MTVGSITLFLPLYQIPLASALLLRLQLRSLLIIRDRSLRFEEFLPPPFVLPPSFQFLSSIWPLLGLASLFPNFVPFILLGALLLLSAHSFA